MNLPKKVKVLYQDYKIDYTQEIKDDDGNEVYGDINPWKDIIQVNPTVSKKNQEVTLLHEIIHAIDSTMLIGLKEKQVEQLSVGLYMVMQDNPSLFSER